MTFHNVPWSFYNRFCQVSWGILVYHDWYVSPHPLRLICWVGYHSTYVLNGGYKHREERMGLESIEKRMREMGENILLDMVVWVHSGWTCLLNMEVGLFLGRFGWDSLFRKVLSHGPCGVATFNYHSIIYNKYCQGHSTPTLSVHYSAPSQGQLVLLAVLIR